MSTSQADQRPFPAGSYPVVVVGSGPGGLQVSYYLRRLGIDHAVLSQDPGPGGMFRRLPVFQRLLSWSKIDAPFPLGSTEYEWYDHNSPVADEPEHQALVVREMGRDFMVPSREEMERGLATFAREAPVPVRYECRWTATHRNEEGFVLETTDGEYRTSSLILAVGVTDPWRPPIDGLDEAPHYAELRASDYYRGKRVVVVGKRNSAFELASGLEPWARQILVVSPRPVATSVLALSTVRARYLQPLENASWGGGTLVLDAVVDRVARTESGWTVTATGTTHAGPIRPIEADEVIAATGFSAPLGDLPAHGLETVAGGRLPALTPFWESVTLPGVYFAGNATQGAAGLRRHGVSSGSGSVAGFRYNARVLARHLAETRFGVAPTRAGIDSSSVVAHLLHELTHRAELWAQKAYLARVLSFDGSVARDEGIVPLAHFLDSGGLDGIAATVEMDAEGTIYPAVFRRQSGVIAELTLPPDPLNDFRGDDYARELREFVLPLGRV